MSAMDNPVIHRLIQRRPAQETCRQVDTVLRRRRLTRHTQDSTLHLKNGAVELAEVFSRDFGGFEEVHFRNLFTGQYIQGRLQGGFCIVNR